MGKKKRGSKRISAGEVPLPEGFRREMEDLLGDEAQSLLSALEEAPETSLRLNRRKLLAELPYSGMERVDWCDHGYYLTERPDFGHNPLLYAGAFYVQEASSMIYEQAVGLLAAAIRREKGAGALIKALDMCAAPGGKTTAILNALEGDYLMVANEYDRKRVKILKENLDKWGADSVIVTNADSETLGRLTEQFDFIAVDAPCSGEGMMRREPIARSQWSEGLVESCSKLQREIIENAVEALKPGGYLIYSTCTFNRRENEENVDYFVNELGLESVELPLKGIEKAKRAIGSDVNALRFMPHLTRGEGLFVAFLKKTGELCAEGSSRGNGKGKTQIGDLIYDTTPEIREMLKILSHKSINARILSAGVPVRELKGGLEKPWTGSVVHGGDYAQAYPQIELSEEDAVKYLRRESIALPEGVPTGYVTVSYKGHPLGLIKNLGNRANNLYPAEWKIIY